LIQVNDIRLSPPKFDIERRIGVAAMQQKRARISKYDIESVASAEIT
jgi:hypothetical protein